MPANGLDRLLSITKEGTVLQEGRSLPDSWQSGLELELGELLRRVNGFYAFESALRMRGLDCPGDILNWNDPMEWRDSYGDLSSGLLFFAEDIFGGQFAIDRDSIVTFDPETGEREHFSTDFAGWSERILDDYNVVTGASIAHEWQISNGPLKVGQRLIPTVPFIFGGEYSLANLRPMSDTLSMRMRGETALQIENLPDGTRVEFVVDE